MQNDINAIIAANKGLIYKQLHKFSLIKDQEAESIGYQALHNAIVTYDGTKGIKFSTYGTVCIYNALGSYVRTMKKQRQLEVLSYNSIAYTADGAKHEFVDFFMSPDKTEDNCVKNELHDLLWREFTEECSCLKNIKHAAIIDKWGLSDFTATTVEIAREVGVSQPYVSQVLSNFKYRLRKRLEEYYYG